MRRVEEIRFCIIIAVLTSLQLTLIGISLPPAAANVTDGAPAAGEKTAKAATNEPPCLKPFSKHLASKDWMARAMAIIGMSGIDESKVTDKLIELMAKDPEKAVRVFAWEALHARQDRLRPALRKRWIEAAYKLAGQNAINGDLRLGLVGIMDAGGPTARNKALFKQLFNTTNSLDSCDIRVLQAMGDALKRWRSRDLVKGLIKNMDSLNCAYRSELILRRITKNIEHSSTLADAGSKQMWANTQDQWRKWFKRIKVRQIAPSPDVPYKGLSALMPRPGKNTPSDDNESNGNKDKKQENFRMDQLEVAFAVDSTGSMGKVVEWIQRDVIKMMRAFEMVSREPRIGVTLYRDHGDKYVTKSLYLRSSGKELAKTLRKATARGGEDIPEAVYEALRTVVKSGKQNWSKGAAAKKFVVLVGDAPPHRNTSKKVKQLVTSAAESDFRFFCIKADTGYGQTYAKKNWDRNLRSFDRIAEWGNGRSLWVTFPKEKDPWDLTTAQPRTNPPDRAIFREVLTAALDKGYHGRLEPFVDVLLSYVDTPVREKRESFGPYAPPEEKWTWTGDSGPKKCEKHTGLKFVESRKYKEHTGQTSPHNQKPAYIPPPAPRRNVKLAKPPRRPKKTKPIKLPKTAAKTKTNKSKLIPLPGGKKPPPATHRKPGGYTGRRTRRRDPQAR